MITILNAPAEIMMSGNPIAYKLQTNNAATAFFVLRLYVETYFQSGVYENIIDLPSPPDAALQTTIYIDKHLHPCLADFVPDFSSASAQKAAQTVKRYYVELAELSATDSIETGNYTAQPVKYVMKAKWHSRDFPKRGANLLPNNQFLYRRKERYLGLTQKDWLSIIPTGDIADLQLVYFLNYTDNTTTNYTVGYGAVRKYEPFFLPLGFAERLYNSVNPTKTISWISISLPYGQTLKLIPIDLSSARMATEVHYYNNFGGLESYVFSGALREEKEMKFEEMQHYQPYNYGQTDAEFKVYEKTVRRNASLFSGFMPYPEDTYLLDAIESPQFFIKQPNGDYYKANNKTNKQTAIDTYERIKSLKIEFDYSFEE